MYRSLALLTLPLLVVGCGSSGPSSESGTTIDSFRSSFFSGQQPATSSQVAAMPQPAAGRASAASRATPADRSANNSEPQAAAAATNPAREPPYKASVAAYIKRYAVDSDSLKLAKIGTPFQGSVNGQKGSVVCVELGGLSSNRTAYLLKDDTVTDSEFGSPACRDKHLEPWDNIGT